MPSAPLPDVATTLDLARQAGNYLIEAKAGVPHGEWTAWVAANVEVSERAVRQYMQIAEGWPQIEDAKRHGRAVLGIDDARRLLAKPRSAAESEPQQPESEQEEWYEPEDVGEACDLGGTACITLLTTW